MKDRIEKSLSILKETSIAGLKFCIIANNKFEKIFWILIGILGIAGISILFFIQIQSWNTNPIMSTRKRIDLSEVELPAITFCHQGNTRTEIADRLIQAADEKSPKIRQLRSLILKYSFEFMINQNDQFKRFSSDISKLYNQDCISSLAGNQCEDCFCNNFAFALAYGKENNFTMEQVYENIFVDLKEEDDISIGLTKIEAKIAKTNENNYNISETLGPKDFQWTFLEKIDAILRIVPKIPAKMPMDFSKTILPLLAFDSSPVTKENMDELYNFFKLPNNEVNLMTISHLFTINDIGQLGKSNSNSFWSKKELYLGGVPNTFQKCFKEIYEDLYKPENEEYNE